MLIPANGRMEDDAPIRRRLGGDILDEMTLTLLEARAPHPGPA